MMDHKHCCVHAIGEVAPQLCKKSAISLLFPQRRQGMSSGTIKDTMAFDHKQYGMNSGIGVYQLKE